MRMVMDTGAEILAPDAQDIEEALTTLNNEEGRFARLERTDDIFIQTGRHGEDDFALEYSDGDQVERIKQRLSWDEVLGAFQQFAAGEVEWRENYKWTKAESITGTPTWWWPLVVAVLIFLALVLLG